MVAIAGLFSGAQEAKAFDAFFGNPYLGAYDYGFANRLPTPPYFAIFPPVYYGRRYERPYGDSPFASMSHLGGNPSYNIRPKQSPVQWNIDSRSVGNAHEPVSVGVPQTVTSSASETSTEAVTGKQVTIINPYVRSDKAFAGN